MTFKRRNGCLFVFNFTSFLRPAIDPIASAFDKLLCGRSRVSNEAKGYTLEGTTLSGSDYVEASRRRERGARALEERLAAEKAAKTDTEELPHIDAEENV